MTICWNEIEAKLRWVTNWNRLVARRPALASAVIASLFGGMSHAVLAQPWNDHGALAHAMTQEAACAGAATLLFGGTPLEIKMAAIDHLVKGGFRKVHGYEVLVTHRSIDHELNGSDFSVTVSVVHQDQHYLLEELIDYRPSWTVQSVVVDEAEFDQCNRDLLISATLNSHWPSRS